MTRRRFVFVFCAAASASVACSFVQSLDYLQNGPPLDDGGDVATPDGGADGSLVPTEIAVGQQRFPDLLAQDDANLYWVNRGSAEIMSAPKPGGDARTVAGNIGTSVTILVADPGAGGSLFWVADGVVRKVAKAAGPDVTTIVSVDGGAVNSIAVDRDSLFAATSTVSGVPPGTVTRMTKDGTSPQILDQQDEPVAIAVDDLGVVWVESGGATRSTSKTGGAVTTFGKPDEDLLAPDPPSAFLLDDTTVYSGEGFDIWSMPRRPGGTAASLFAPPGDNPKVRGIALDGATMWYVDAASGTVGRFPKNGLGAGEIVAIQQRGASSVVVDGTYVYFTVQATASDPEGAVVRLRK
ncbi:MAG: hypothetical protein KF819_04585 [Labilithrix sp.]|nr:hypothetical protein [Labilithrix sp.]